MHARTHTHKIMTVQSKLNPKTKYYLTPQQIFERVWYATGDEINFLHKLSLLKYSETLLHMKVYSEQVLAYIKAMKIEEKHFRLFDLKYGDGKAREFYYYGMCPLHIHPTENKSEWGKSNKKKTGQSFLRTKHVYIEKVHPSQSELDAVKRAFVVRTPGVEVLSGVSHPNGSFDPRLMEAKIEKAKGDPELIKQAKYGKTFGERHKASMSMSVQPAINDTGLLAKRDDIRDAMKGQYREELTDEIDVDTLNPMEFAKVAAEIEKKVQQRVCYPGEYDLVEGAIWLIWLYYYDMHTAYAKWKYQTDLYEQDFGRGDAGDLCAGKGG